MKPKPVRPGDSTIPADTINWLIENVAPLSNLRAGPGVRIARTSAGVTISADAVPVVGTAVAASGPVWAQITQAVAGEVEAFFRGYLLDTTLNPSGELLDIYVHPQPVTQWVVDEFGGLAIFPYISPSASVTRDNVVPIRQISRPIIPRPDEAPYFETVWMVDFSLLCNARCPA